MELEIGNLINAQDEEEDQPPLHYAVVTFLTSASPSKHISDLQELIDAGAELDAKSEYGNTPLHLVAWNDQAPERRVIRTLKIQIDAGADVNIRNGSG